MEGCGFIRKALGRPLNLRLCRVPLQPRGRYALAICSKVFSSREARHKGSLSLDRENTSRRRSLEETRATLASAIYCICKRFEFRPKRCCTKDPL